MKILLAIDTYQTNNNGTSISAQRYAGTLRQHGHQVRVLSVDSDDYRLPERHIYPFNRLIHMHGFRFANSLSRSSRATIREAIGWCDMVHCMMPFVLSNRVKKMADKLGKPATAAFHIQPENITSSIRLGKASWVNDMLYKLFYQLVYKHFHHVHTPSQFMADELIKHGYDMHLHPISNGIDPSFCYRKEPKDAPWMGSYLIVMTGRLSVEKRQDLLLKAVRYSKYCDRIQLVFAGKGPLYRTYRWMGRRLPHTPVFGYYCRADLQHLLAQADLYVHASDMEREAIGCIEAFAMGLVPVISDSALSATRQFALCDQSLFQAGSARSLARRIDYWIEHEDEKRKMECVYAQFAKAYLLENCVAAFEQMLFREQMEWNQRLANQQITTTIVCQKNKKELSPSELQYY